MMRATKSHRKKSIGWKSSRLYFSSVTSQLKSLAITRISLKVETAIDLKAHIMSRKQTLSVYYYAYEIAAQSVHENTTLEED